MTVAQTVSDQAQSTTISLSALGFITGNQCADTFYPPGNVADFFGFQHLRDNDATGLGHNTAFAASVGQNVLAILTDSQNVQLVTLAKAQVSNTNKYAYARMPLMQAFRRLLTGTIPTGTSGLSASAVQAYSANQLYAIDAQITSARAKVFAAVIASLSTAQKTKLDALAAKGVGAWPNAQAAETRWAAGLTTDQHVGLMTNASELFSWYAGNAESDTYFSPERQGTYFGSFYLKDAPALLSQSRGKDVTISSNLTADYGALFLNALDTTQRSLLTSYRTSDAHLGLNATLGDPCTARPTTAAYLYSELITMPKVASTDAFFK